MGFRLRNGSKHPPWNLAGQSMLWHSSMESPPLLVASVKKVSCPGTYCFQPHGHAKITLEWLIFSIEQFDKSSASWNVPLQVKSSIADQSNNSLVDQSNFISKHLFEKDVDFLHKINDICGQLFSMEAIKWHKEIAKSIKNYLNWDKQHQIYKSKQFFG